MPQDYAVYSADDAADDEFGDGDIYNDNSGVMVTYCIQYKSSKTTYNLYTGHFGPHTDSIFRGHLTRGATYMRIYIVVLVLFLSAGWVSEFYLPICMFVLTTSVVISAY